MKTIEELKADVEECGVQICLALQSGDEGELSRARRREDEAVRHLINEQFLQDAPTRLEEATRNLIELAAERDGASALVDELQADHARLFERLNEINQALQTATDQAAESLVDKKKLSIPADLAALMFERDATQAALAKLEAHAIDARDTLAAFPEKLYQARNQFYRARRDVAELETRTALESLMPLLARAAICGSFERPSRDPSKFVVEIDRELFEATTKALREEIPA